ncbi:MAG: zinc-binding dehydrogenase [Coriobacteriales bacterium]|jgi:threonine dehydrogenase-like Zn-dependent dehydrogenase|nr:zinc-binding dehydrogenase [Coriobacteriales bacterium]
MRGYGMFSVNHPGWLEKERPTCGPLDAIVAPTIVAPCSSDTHSMHGGAGPKDNMILGHEAVGTVVEVGSAVRHFKPGDFVVVPCVTPDWLEIGVQNSKSFSHDSQPFGSFKFINSEDGVMAEFFRVVCADANLTLLLDGVTPEQALMTVDMMSTGFYGAEMADVQFGDTVVVIGIGPVGLMAVGGAALRGAGRIIGVGTRPNCIKVAREYGATDIVNYKEGDIVEQVMDLTGGADKVIIAGGTKDTLGQALAMTKAMGAIASVNYYDAADTLCFPALAWGLGMANKDIRSGFCPGGAARIQKLMATIKYRGFDAAKIISHTFHGFEAMEPAFKLMDEKAPDLIKPIVYIDDLQAQ